MKILLACLLALMLPWAAAAQTAPVLTERQKVEALIVTVERLPGAVFIRNGGEFTGAQAASHLRLKAKTAGKRIKTAKDFILFCASASSMSGKKYQIRFADGRTVDSAEFFYERLQQIESGVKLPVAKQGGAAQAH